MKPVLEKIKLYRNYICIGILSLIALFVLPFMGSTLGLAFNIPNTPAGWVVFVVGNLSTSTLSLMIYHCFIKQGKVNIANDPHFLEAEEILSHTKQKTFVPRTPGKFLAEQYGKKGTTLFISSLVAMVGLSNAALNFEIAILLAFIAVVFSSIVFGVVEMAAVEDYWTDEYWLYAKKIQKEEEEEKARLAKEKEAEILEKEVKLNDKIRERLDSPQFTGTSKTK